MKIYKKGQKGFTLIELLVVVVIIGLLTTVATTNYMASQAKARDGARKTQTSSIATAIETFYAVKKKFPGKGPTDTEYSNDFITNYADCETPITSNLNILPTKYYIEYSYKPLYNSIGATNLSCNLRNNTAAGANPSYVKEQYSPFPTWIPEMGDYLTPAPVDKKYQSSIGISGVNNDAYKSMLASGNKTRTYAYMKLDSGYMVYTKLETSDDKNALNGKEKVSCENAGLNYHDVTGDEYCYTESTNTPIIPLKINADNLYIIRR